MSYTHKGGGCIMCGSHLRRNKLTNTKVAVMQWVSSFWRFYFQSGKLQRHKTQPWLTPLWFLFWLFVLYFYVYVCVLVAFLGIRSRGGLDTTGFKCAYRQRYTLTNPVLFNGKCNGICHIWRKNIYLFTICGIYRYTYYIYHYFHICLSSTVYTYNSCTV